MALRNLSNTAKASLNDKLASWKEFRQSSKIKSKVWKKLVLGNEKVAHVVNRVGEKRVFWEALRRRGLESKTSGFRRQFGKRELKKVLGDIEHSGEFSHKEMHILGEELIGGVASKRIDRSDVYNPHASHTTENIHSSNHSLQEKIHSDIRETHNEIINKTPLNNSTNQTLQSVNRAKVLDFPAANKNEKAAEAVVKPVARNSELGSSISRGYIPNHFRQFAQHEDIEKVKSILARIQDKDDNNNEDEDLAKAA